MNELTISRDTAIAEYRTADEAGRAMLEKLFGREQLTQSITERVKTFEDACAVIGVNPRSVDFTAGNADDWAYQKLKVIAKALNEGWTPNWDDANEYKYYPWFRCFGEFSFGNVDCYYSGSLVGSRLCFRSEELAEYAGRTFLDLYRAFIK